VLANMPYNAFIMYL